MDTSPSFRFFTRSLFTIALASALWACASPSISPTTPTSAPAPTPAAPPQPVASSSFGTPAVWPSSAPQIFAQSAILIDARSGRVIYEKNADVQRQVASTQKLLTALIVAEKGDLNEIVTIQPSDTSVEPTKLGVKAGEKYPRNILLQTVLVKSTNDLAAALARDFAGSQQAFAEHMNRVAQSLGAESSHFVNPHGLPAHQYSTARDMARIAFRAYRNPDLRRMMLIRNMSFRFNNGRTTSLKTTNDLLERSPSFTGMKTGYTVAAGRCLITSATINGREMILVQLGSKTKYIFDDAERLLRWAAYE